MGSGVTHLVESQPSLDSVAESLKAEFAEGDIVCNQLRGVFSQEGVVSLVKLQGNIKMEESDGGLDILCQESVDLDILVRHSLTEGELVHSYKIVVVLDALLADRIIPTAYEATLFSSVDDNEWEDVAARIS